MPTRNATGIVLRRINLGEADRLLTVLTREYGKVSAVAKGARRPGGKLAGASELFTHAAMQLASGRNLDILTQCEVEDSFTGLREDLSLLARASYFCELVDRLTEQSQPQPDVFDLLLAGLHLLDRAGAAPDTIVHAFELRLLAVLGYAPALDHCARCAGALGQERAAYSPSQGGALCGACRYQVGDSIAVSSETLLAMRTLAEAPAAELIQMELAERSRQEIARCMRWHIRLRCERDLKSLEFLEQVRRTETAAAPSPNAQP